MPKVPNRERLALLQETQKSRAAFGESFRTPLPLLQLVKNYLARQTGRVPALEAAKTGALHLVDAGRCCDDLAGPAQFYSEHVSPVFISYQSRSPTRYLRKLFRGKSLSPANCAVSVQHSHISSIFSNNTSAAA